MKEQSNYFDLYEFKKKMKKKNNLSDQICT